MFANSEEVVYVYSSTREGKILDEVLNGCDGVVISDFYTAYDSFAVPSAEMFDSSYQRYK